MSDTPGPADVVRSTVAITFAAAGRVLAAAVQQALAEGIAVCVTVADPAGHPVVAGRMDGAPLLSAGIAADKAYTVAAFNGVPTHDWHGMIAGEPALAAGIVHTPRLVIFGGGLPLRVGGELVGAIGVSGGSAEQDVLVANAGAVALG